MFINLLYIAWVTEQLSEISFAVTYYLHALITYYLLNVPLIIVWIAFYRRFGIRIYFIATIFALAQPIVGACFIVFGTDYQLTFNEGSINDLLIGYLISYNFEIYGSALIMLVSIIAPINLIKPIHLRSYVVGLLASTVYLWAVAPILFRLLYGIVMDTI